MRLMGKAIVFVIAGGMFIVACLLVGYCIKSAWQLLWGI